MFLTTGSCVLSRRVGGFRRQLRGLPTSLYHLFSIDGKLAATVSSLVFVFFLCLGLVLEVCASILNGCRVGEVELSVTSLAVRSSHFCGMHVVESVGQEVRFAFGPWRVRRSPHQCICLASLLGLVF